MMVSNDKLEEAKRFMSILEYLSLEEVKRFVDAVYGVAFMNRLLEDARENKKQQSA